MTKCIANKINKENICCRVYISIQEQIYQFCEKRKVLSFFVEDCWKGEFDSLN